MHLVTEDVHLVTEDVHFVNKDVHLEREPIVLELGDHPVFHRENSVRISKVKIHGLEIERALIEFLRRHSPSSEGPIKPWVEGPIDAGQASGLEAGLFKDPHESQAPWYLPAFRLAPRAAGMGYEVSVKLLQGGLRFVVVLAAQRSARLDAGSASPRPLHWKQPCVLLHLVHGGLEITFVAGSSTVEANDRLRGVFDFTNEEGQLLLNALSGQVDGVSASLSVERSVDICVKTTRIRKLFRGLRAKTLRLRRFDPVSGMVLPVEKPLEHPIELEGERVVRWSCGPTALRSTVEDAAPLTLPTDLHPYFWQGVTLDGNVASVRRHVVEWEGEHHAYYSDPYMPNTVYYLPDRFVLVRREMEPRAPAMLINFATDDAGETRVFVQYVARPSVRVERLAAALPELIQKLSAVGALSEGQVEMVPLAAKVDSYKLHVPVQGGPQLQERTDALVSLEDGIRDVLEMSLGDFQSFYAAMSTESSLVFTGLVQVSPGQGMEESIPFEGRLDLVEGSLFDLGPSQRVGDTLERSLRNSIESSVVIESLKVGVSRPEGATEVSHAVTSLIVDGEASAPQPLPVTVPPGATLMVRVKTTAETPESAELLIDPEEVEIQVDAKKVLEAIVDPSASSFATRTIQVETLEDVFVPHIEPREQVRRLLVQFQGGRTADGNDTVKLSAEMLSAKIDVSRDLYRWLLNNEDASTYRYKRRVVRLSGTSADPEWIEDNIGILIVVPGEL